MNQKYSINCHYLKLATHGPTQTADTSATNVSAVDVISAVVKCTQPKN